MFRTNAPQAAKKADFNIPQTQKFVLANGIEIYFVKKENLPIVYLSALVSGGSKFDKHEKLGTAYLTSLLIDEGAGEFDALELSDEFEKLGVMFNVSVHPDDIAFSLLSLTDNFEHSLYLLSNIITKPRFTEADFLREKKKVQDRLLQLKDEAGYIASSVFEKMIFKNTFYEFPEIGFTETVSLITNNDVKDFYKNYFGSNALKFFIVGNLQAEQLVDLLNKYLGNFQPVNVLPNDFVYPQKQKTQYYIIDKKDSAQSEIRIGHISTKRNEMDFYSARIMNTILGGQFSSRINLNLREDKGFTYGAGSSFSFLQNAGLFEVHTAVNLQNSAAAVKEIFYELIEIRKSISAEEIEFAKSYLIKQYPSRFETFSQIAKNIESLVTHSLPLDELNVYEENLFAVTNENVLQSAVNNISPNESFVVICGEKESVSKQLKDELGVDAIELTHEGKVV